MSIRKKSFLLYVDTLDVLDEMTDEEAGKLFKAIKDYHHGETICSDSSVRIPFSPFKNQFARDYEKYEKLCEKNRLIAEKRYSLEATKSTTGVSGNQKAPESTKSTDKDSDSGSGSGSGSGSEILDLNTSQKPKVVCPHTKILKLWDEIMPRHIARPKEWTSERPSYNHLKIIWAKTIKASHDEGALVWIERFFHYITTSEFLMTEKFFDLPWALKPANFIKIKEGKYEHQQSN